MILVYFLKVSFTCITGFGMIRSCIFFCLLSAQINLVDSFLLNRNPIKIILIRLFSYVMWMCAFMLFCLCQFSLQHNIRANTHQRILFILSSTLTILAFAPVPFQSTLIMSHYPVCKGSILLLCVYISTCSNCTFW